MAPFSELPKDYDPQKDRIEIAEYDPLWPEMYRREEAALRGVLEGFAGLRIEHFGSTAVPGLPAKPVIDIMVAVGSRSLWPRMVEPLQGLGYAFWNANPDKEQFFFVKGMPPYGERRTHHVHIYEYQGARWKKELAFRDILRDQPQAARQYEALKRGLAAKFALDRESYTAGKSEFIRDIVDKIVQ